MAKKRVFLLTWKPDKWPVEAMIAGAKAFEMDGEFIDLWRIKAWRQAEIGDQVFAMRQGPKGPIVYGRGEVAGPPVWPATKGEGASPLFPVRFLWFTDPTKGNVIDEPTTRHILGHKVNYKASGLLLTEEEADALSAEIDSRLPLSKKVA